MPAQAVVRACAVVLMLVQILFGRLPDLRLYKACAFLLAGMVTIVVVQLIPLPPSLWAALPGRAIIASSPLGAGSWRPLNLAPDAGWNALFSLLVPLCVLILMASLSAKTVSRTYYVIIGATMFSALLALLQAAGSAPDNPLINGSMADYAGIFANRNHQALFLAIGIVLAGFWGAKGGGSWRDRRLWLAICVVLLLLVSILVTGSRSGALLGGIAAIAGPLVALPYGSRRRPSKLRMILWPTISLVVVAATVFLSSYFGRAASLERATDLTMDSEFRLRALPVVWATAKSYFPFGAGMGTFDNVFRIAEPFALLEPTYFNHAHNDLLETVIETGIFGPILFLCALIWAARRIVAVRSLNWDSGRMVRMGALVCGLIIFASVSDYPARAPMIMATMMIAACWLTAAQRDNGGGERFTRPAQPPIAR